MSINQENKDNSQTINHMEIIQQISNTGISEQIYRKIAFKPETLRNLVTMASHEFYNQTKQDQILSLMLEKIINEHYSEFIKQIQK